MEPLSPAESEDGRGVAELVGFYIGKIPDFHLPKLFVELVLSTRSRRSHTGEWKTHDSCFYEGLWSNKGEVSPWPNGGPLDTWHSHSRSPPVWVDILNFLNHYLGEHGLPSPCTLPLLLFRWSVFPWKSVPRTGYTTQTWPNNSMSS